MTARYKTGSVSGGRKEDGLERTMKSEDTCHPSQPNCMPQLEREISYHFRKLEAEVTSLGKSMFQQEQKGEGTV